MNARILAVSAAAVLSTLLVACQSGPKVGPGEVVSATAGVSGINAAKVGGNLFRAVEEHVRSQGSILNDTPHQTAYTDLNNDGLIDVLLMLNAPEWCIGDSCTLMIFEGTETGAKMLAELTLISSPISVGDANETGWRDIFVTLPGSAGKSTMARVDHNGQGYPESPSQWRFLANNGTLPGRPVLVGGGAQGSDLAGFDQLLTELDTGGESGDAVASTALTGVSGSQQNFYGRYSWGPGEAYFRPCGGASVYWVIAGERVGQQLDDEYRQIATQQFDDVYLEMKAISQPTPDEGDASFYDGVLEIEQVISMIPVDENTCSQAPSS